MKKVLSGILILLLAFSLIGCAGEKSTESQKTGYTATDISVACIKGPTGFGMAKLMYDAEKGKCENNYTFTVASSADEISGKIITGEINIACVPTNLAAKLYTKTDGKIRMLAVNTLGTLAIIENGNSINGFSDLKGQTIYSIGEGSNPEYILKYILKQNDIDPDKDVKLNFVPNNDDLIAAIVSGKAKVAMVPEPAATTVLTKKNTLRRALDINSEWEKSAGGKLMMGCIIALDSFTEKYPEQIAKFLGEYEKSVNYSVQSTNDAANLCEKYEIVPSAAIAESAIPNSNLTFVTASDAMKDLEKYFSVLSNFDKTSIGGKLPDENFYYKK